MIERGINQEIIAAREDCQRRVNVIQESMGKPSNVYKEETYPAPVYDIKWSEEASESAQTRVVVYKNFISFEELTDKGKAKRGKFMMFYLGLDKGIQYGPVRDEPKTPKAASIDVLRDLQFKLGQIEKINNNEPPGQMTLF